jgi:putative SOS response-associated peptidase YedK
MCGRFTLTSEPRLIERRFGAKFITTDWRATYNAAPAQRLPIIRSPHRIELGTWGFVPEHWKGAQPIINARFETADDKRSFHASFRTRHCLVLADSFYEWTTVNGRKQPYRFLLKTGEPFAMAGIYAREPAGFGEAERAPVTFAILTTAANDAVRPLHQRMPVILPLGKEKQTWLPAMPSGMLYLPPFPAELMASYPVSSKINNAAFDEPAAIAPLERVLR